MNQKPENIKEVDILVIGAGAGGMAAALTASILGRDVLVCEKSGQIGGTAATSAGTVWIPGNRQSQATGLADSPDAARLYLEALLPDPADGRALREAYLADGPRAIDWFAKHSDVQFVPCGKHPDYFDLVGACIAGRALAPVPFDGRLLGENFTRVRAPIPEFMVLGGMMVSKDDVSKLIGRFQSLQNFMHAAKLLLRYAMDRTRHARGTRLVMGNALVARLFYSLQKRNVPVWFNAGLLELVREGQRVVGALLSVDDRTVIVRARRGVVLATGGFAHNAELRRTFMPTPIPTDSMAVPSNSGDGIAAALKIGALTAGGKHGTGAFWTPVSRTESGRWAGLFPHLLLDRAKPGLIAVNSAGLRFVNEGVSYHHFVEAMFESNKSVPTIPAWLICDSDFIMKYGLGAIRPGTRHLGAWARKGYITVAPTLAQLANKIGVDSRGLVDTVQRHNEFAYVGNDEDFGKGTTELNRFNGDPSHRPNPCLGPILEGPFCAIAVWPADLGCSAGLETDEHARVLSEQGTPIAGLYACGNDLASMMRGTYPGPGTTLGPALVFGWRAARHAASSATQS